MKKILSVLIVLSLFIVGCSKEESDLVSNEVQVKNKNAVNEDTQDKTKDNSKEKLNSTPKEDTEEDLKAENIRKDYEQKVLENQDIKSVTSGISKYNDILISTLKSYDINNLESAKVVYELSEELLTDIYGFYKTNWDETSFKNLRQEQRTWVNDKMSTENTLSKDELLKYQTLSKIVLDRCEVLNSYYNNNIFSED